MIQLSNREIAWLIWLGIALSSVLAQQSLREPLGQVVRAFCARPILLSVGVMLAYIGLCVLLLYALNIWEWDNFKTTLLWCVTFAFVTMMDVSRISEDDTFYRKAARDTVGATAFLLYVAEVKSFPLFAELLLVPGMVFLGGLLAFAQVRPEGKDVRGVIEATASLLGFALLLASVTAIWNQPDQFFTWATVRDFVVPILLSLLFLPFIYVLSAYCLFERLFARIAFSIPVDAVRRYAKVKSMFVFAADLNGLRRWGRNIGISQPSSPAEVDRSIREVLEATQRESAPALPPEQGWSPYIAKAFLESEGLKTDDYHRSYDDLWHASAMPQVIDDSILPSTIDYVVEGNMLAATRLKLRLKVFVTTRESVEQKDEAQHKFARMAEMLGRAAVQEVTPGQISEAILAGASHVDAGQLTDIRIAREDWKNANLSGFELTVHIAHRCHLGGHDELTAA